MNATTVSWTIAIFFGCSIAFGALRRLTNGDGAGVTIAVQGAALLLVVAVIVLVVRRSGGSR